MKPVHFGPAGRRLFGIYDLPPPGSKPAGVVLCNPMAHEALRAHRALRLLSLRLARAGYQALRFDYFGCGDSEGETEEGDADQWIGDVGITVETLKSECGLGRVSLVGLRLGATFAALAAAGRGDVESLTLWEPVLDGRAYLREERAAHATWLRHRAEEQRLNDGPEQSPQLLGFPLSATLEASLEVLDLLALRKAPAPRVLVVEREQGGSGPRLADHLSALGARVEYRHIPGPQVWTRLGMDQAMVPRQTLESIEAWLARLRP